MDDFEPEPTGEGISYVTCQICGARRKRINNSHLRMHSLTSAEYQNLYPDTQMFSDLTRRKQRIAITGKKASAETRRKLSEARSGKNHPNFGKHHSDETKQKMSESRIEGLRTGRIIHISGENHPFFGLVGEKNPFFGKKHSKETKQKMSKVRSGKNHYNFGKHLSDDHKKKLSELHKELFRTGKRKVSKHIGFGKVGYRPDLGIFVRSTWEANIARILNYKGIKWVYEPQRFDLGEYTYLPDFYLPEEDRWIELKGYTPSDQKERVAYQFREFNKNHNLTVIDKPTYKQLEKEYKHLISEWETSKRTNIVHRVRVRGGAIKGNFTYRNVKKLFRRSKLKC